ncbi:hypothetical protein SELMODRAFT_159225 [Selaginella moellendorffii]|uniref:Glutaredoxin-dependent peroxiredoxin n=1 Tax=Selaginella moellendorffii TaxID=88036 RepID=D8SXT7_SELML|nr:peroxiredoxin-2 [Selaginella moellendorffii]EFJ10855.1 hypothetical protein SELMODRAFT_159225 [Selaginella moellendorffii]|eukprot:XP_002988063.1 peroxiredoxin-2 [Selaginella moellendorffii]
MAPIGVEEIIPDGTLSYFDKDGKLQNVSIYALAEKKKVVLFGVPGAFTPTCSLKHVPGYIDKAPELKAKGVDKILCLTVNDPFVVREWAKTYPEDSAVMFLADGSATYTKSLGLELDLTERGMGIRSKRFALLLDDLVVKAANIEEGGDFKVSSADDILAVLP